MFPSWAQLAQLPPEHEAMSGRIPRILGGQELL
jgi:hypothetical protein